MEIRDILRHIPKVDELLAHEAIISLTGELTAGTVRILCREGTPGKKRLIAAWTLTAVAALGLYLVGLKQTSLIQSADGKLNAIYPALRTLELISTALDWLRTGGFAAADLIVSSV